MEYKWTVDPESHEVEYKAEPRQQMYYAEASVRRPSLGITLCTCLFSFLHPPSVRPVFARGYNLSEVVTLTTANS
jgi:hypothetical protein